MRHFPENSLVLWFYNWRYHGCIRSYSQKRAVEVALVLQKRTAEVVLQKRAVDVVVVQTVVAAAARVRVTHGDNHTQHTAPCIIHQNTVRSTSYPPYTVLAFLMDIEVTKTKAQERYGNTSGMKIFLHKLEKGTLLNPEVPKKS
jgi:hypothetical protein